jgi:hypothetical protein
MPLFCEDFYLRSFRQLLVFAACTALVACNGTGKNMPQTATPAQPDSASLSAAQPIFKGHDDPHVIKENVARPILWAPDRSYRLVQPHSPGIALRQGIMFQAGGRYTSQRLYSTSLGPITIVQASYVLSPRFRRILSDSSPLKGVTAHGATQNGLTWMLMPMGHQSLLEMFVSGSILQCTLPHNVDLDMLGRVVETVK